ncbi:TonB-dependent receptor [Flavobacteriaceae bacterium]|nr:TonB-dependent receptor [Flavobacteriaceae bacterium]
MKLKQLLIYSLIFFAFSLNAQKKSTVTASGIVMDGSTGTPLEYATIVLTPQEGQKLHGGITDTEGKFNIDLPAGLYKMSIEFISFKTLTFENVDLTSNKDFGVVTLQEDANTLDEVEIVAEKSTVDIRLDKRIYNVGADMTIKGGTASDVLDNVPSVTVDVDGAVSLRGNDNVRILINGKPSGLVGLSTTDVLRQLPADAIEKVEVITSPSARYEAEGTGGILNIILRKGKAEGFNASVNVSGGYPELYSGSANVNYRAKKYNIFSNFGYRKTDAPGYSYNDLTYFNQDGSVNNYRSEYTDWTRDRYSNNNNLGIEYYINDHSSITAGILYRLSGGDRYSVNEQKRYDLSYTETDYKERIQDEESDQNLVEYSLNYTNDFDNDSQLTAAFRYETSSEDEYADIQDVVYLGTDPDTQERNTTENSREEMLLQLDYTSPIGELSQFEAGYRSTFTNNLTDYLVEIYEDGEWVNDTDFSNVLDFTQNVHAAYLQYGSKYEHFNYLLGLRAEYTHIDIDLKTTNEQSEKNYANLFPTLNLGYEFNDSSSLIFGYSKRIRRPRSWFLNPFPSRTSETNYFSGNVDLDPTITSSFDLGVLHQWKSNTVNASVYMNHSTDAIEFVFEETGETINGVPVTRRYPINLATEDRIGVEVTSRHTLAKWLRLNNSFNFFRFTKDGDYTYTNSDGEEIYQNFDAQDNSWFFRLNAIVKLPAEIDWQTNFSYRSASSTAQSDRDGMYSVNLAFSRDILKKNGTLALNVSDLLNSRKRQMTTTTYDSTTGLPTITNESDMMWRQRQTTLTFTYRFKQKKKRGRPSGGYDGGDMEMQGQP